MIVYEVNLAIEREIAEEFEHWLRDHVRQMLVFEGFLAAKCFELQADGNDPDVRQLTVQYEVRDQASLDAYLEKHAAGMREDGLKRFPGRFTATRRILTLLERFEST